MAKSSHQTDYQMDPKAVGFHWDFSDEPNLMNCSSQLSIAEDHFGTNPAFFAAFNPSPDSGCYFPAVTAGASRSTNVLAEGSNPPAAPLGVDGESLNGRVRAGR